MPVQMKRDSWAKIGAVTSIACVCGGFYFGLALVLSGQTDLQHQLLFIIGTSLVSVIFSFAFQRGSRRTYLVALSWLAVLISGSAAMVQYFLKPAISATLYRSVTSLNNLAEDGTVRQKRATTSQSSKNQHMIPWKINRRLSQSDQLTLTDLQGN